MIQGTIQSMRKLLKKAADCRVAVVDLVGSLETDHERQHWESVQREFSGITQEEYEAELEASPNDIRKEF